MPPRHTPKRRLCRRKRGDSPMWALGVSWALTSAALITDLRNNTIPNLFFLLGMVGALTLMIAGVLSWWHLAWALGVWLWYEWRIAQSRRTSGRQGWGDAKLGTAVAALLGGTGLLVIGCGSLGVYLWGSLRWLKTGGRQSWRGQAAPWTPGAWLGLTCLALTFIVTRGGVIV